MKKFKAVNEDIISLKIYGVYINNAVVIVKDSSCTLCFNTQSSIGWNLPKHMCLKYKRKMGWGVQYSKEYKSIICSNELSDLKMIKDRNILLFPSCYE